MESPKFRIKRRFDSLSSPNTDNVTKRSTFKKLQFTPAQSDSPISTKKQSNVEFFDENSCDSGFSDLAKEDCSQSTQYDVLSKLDDSDIDTSFELFDKFDSKLSIESPFMHLKSSSSASIVPETKSNTRKLKTKSKSFQSRTEFNEQSIKQALEVHASETSERLIGDMSRKHTLPILSKSKHNDLASISPETLSDLLNGKYKDQIGEYLILDARYPYEFEGGHISNAENAYFKDKIMEKLFNEPLKCENGKPLVLIFHCEFSSERGPKLMREIREKDRCLNKHCYPSLCYPEIYLLEGGYSIFYQQFDQHCNGNYLPMLHDNHRDDLKFFRRKSKTWELETRKRINKTKLSF